CQTLQKAGEEQRRKLMAKQSQAQSLASLATRALVVDADLSWLYTESPNQKVTDEVAKRHKVPSKTGRYLQQLYPFPIPEYETAKAKYRELKHYYHAHTLPWQYGKRLLKSSFYREFSAEMKTLGEELHTVERPLAR